MIYCQSGMTMLRTASRSSFIQTILLAKSGLQMSLPKGAYLARGQHLCLQAQIVLASRVKGSLQASLLFQGTGQGSLELTLLLCKPGLPRLSCCLQALPTAAPRSIRAYH